MSHFRYVPLNEHSVEFLSAPYVRFSPPNELNDAFELLPDSDFAASEEFFERLWAKNFEAEIHFELALSSVTGGDFRFKTVSDAKREFQKDWKHDGRDRFLGAMAANGWNDRPFGIASFAGHGPDTTNAVLMWAHYAEKSSGVCIEYDLSHPFFTHLTGGTFAAVKAGPVIPSPNRAIYNYLQGDDPTPLIFTKGEQWAYENEYRIIIVLGPYLEKDTAGHMTIMRLDPDSVLSVTFGRNISQKARDTALTAIRGGPLKGLLSRGKIFETKYRHKGFSYERFPLVF